MSIFLLFNLGRKGLNKLFLMFASVCENCLCFSCPSFLIYRLEPIVSNFIDSNEFSRCTEFKETKTITVKSLHAAIHGTITPKMDYFLPKGMIIPPKKIIYALFCQLSRVASMNFWREKSCSLKQLPNTPRTTSVSKWDKIVWTKKNGYRSQLETRHLTLKYVPGCQVRWLRCTWLPGKGTQVRGRGREESETRRWLSHPRGRACCSREPCVQIYFENVLSIKMEGGNMLFNEHGARVQERILGRKMLYLCS